MRLKQESEPAGDALPVSALRDYLRLGSGFDRVAEDVAESEALAGFLRTAIATIEARTGKVLLTCRYTMELDHWREPARQTLPVAPVQAVTSVQVIDAAGQVVGEPAGGWRLVQDDHRPAIVPVGACLPAIPRLGLARISFAAGFGDGWGDLPADLAQAVIMLAAEYYETRGAGGSVRAGLPMQVAGLIERWRQVRVLTGRSLRGAG